ncbi:hypothetical protein lerEdw1_011185 [Lerista edwardsae]|nr:hypothetical protein lerEdw1_011185 [Lerista edwardsae]
MPCLGPATTRTPTHSLPLGETSLGPSPAIRELLAHSPELLAGTLHLAHSPAHILAPLVHTPEHQACTPEHILELRQHQAHILVRQECHPAHRECTLPLGSPQVAVELSQPHPRVDLALDRLPRLEDPLLLWFQVDLKKGQDIAFHFNPRFNEDNRRVIVCNTLLQQNWGKEERTAPRFPFEAGKPFKIQILCEANQLKVAVNDAHLLQYNHRIKELNQITKLSVAGDVTLTSITPTMI